MSESPSSGSLQPVSDPLPDPAKSESRLTQALAFGFSQYETLKNTAMKNERVQQVVEKATEAASTTIDVASKKTDALKEFGKEKQEQLSGLAKQQYDRAMEDERIKGAVDYSWEKGEALRDKTKVLLAKADELKGNIVERTSERTLLAKERSKALWARGKGKIVRVKNEVTEKWGKSAQETLLLQEESRKRWESMKLRGAEDINVPARSEYTTCFLIEKGTVMRWSFRVKDYDVGFGVRLRLMRDGGAFEEDVLPLERFDNGDTIEGSWVADADRTIVLVFDNRYSKLRSKNVAYLVGTEKASNEDIKEVAAIEKEQEESFRNSENQIIAAEVQDAQESA